MVQRGVARFILRAFLLYGISRGGLRSVRQLRGVDLLLFGGRWERHKTVQEAEMFILQRAYVLYVCTHSVLYYRILLYYVTVSRHSGMPVVCGRQRIPRTQPAPLLHGSTSQARPEVGVPASARHDVIIAYVLSDQTTRANCTIGWASF
jgi:hypothetical protein